MAKSKGDEGPLSKRKMVEAAFKEKGDLRPSELQAHIREVFGTEVPVEIISSYKSQLKKKLDLGRSASEWNPIDLRRRIGWVIQEVGLLPHLTIGENVVLVPRLLGWPEERRAARARELLTLLGLDPDRFGPLRSGQLSGGERQRVGLARALAADPPVLLMDEPFGALDPLTRRAVQDEFRDLVKRLGKTVVLVTHDVPEALRLADEVAVMDGGRVLQRASPAELRERPEAGFVRDFLAAALP